jgi:hypothetical protein
MGWEMLAAPIIGGLLGSNSASSANAAQAQATQAATAENARQYDRNIAIEQQRYDQNRSDRAPYMGAGNAALAQYLREMGITLPKNTGFGPRASAAPAQDRGALRASLLPQFTSKPSWVNPDQSNYSEGGGSMLQQLRTNQPGGDPFGGGVNEAGLNSAIDAFMARQTPQGQPDQGGNGLEDYQTTAPQDVQLDPGYEFGKQQGQQALDRQFAKQGGRVSGAAMKAAAEYGTNYATTGYSAAYGRRQDRLNRLGVLAGYGQTAPSGSTGQQPNNGNAALISSQGNATGAAQLAQGNIWGGVVNQVGAQLGRNQPAANNGFGTGSQFGNQDYGQYF